MTSRRDTMGARRAKMQETRGISTIEIPSRVIRPNRWDG